jgi:hypothetical protein
MWKVRRTKIRISTAGCRCRRMAQSGFFSFVYRKKPVKILIPKRKIKKRPLIR